MTRTLRTLLILVGVACLVVAALASFGWTQHEMDPFGVALLGLAAWLASTLP